MTTTAELLLAWDARRPRSMQRDFGVSELGECHRRAGYRLAGVEPTNPSSSVQAVIGTAVHEAIAAVFRQLQAEGLIPAEDLVEEEVRFAGILGHLDRYDHAAASIDDTKTTTSRWLEQSIKIYGPPLKHRWQVNVYGAALVARGLPVRQVRIDYLARDTGEEWTWTGPFEPHLVRDALEWLRGIQATPLEMLNRDYEPDSAFCQHCPFRRACWAGHVPGRDPRSVLYVEHPDAAAWAAKLAQARADKQAAADREAEAKGALDALRPDAADDGPVVVDVGYEHLIRFRRQLSRRLNSTLVKAEYAKTGAKPPTNESVSTYVEFVARDQQEQEVSAA